MTIMAIKAAVARLCSSGALKKEKKKKKKEKKREEEVIMINSSSNSLSNHPASIAGGEFGRVFRYFDEDGDGRISPGELVRALGGQLELPLERAEELVLSADTDGDGLLGFEDFVALADARGEEREEEARGRSLQEAFEAYTGDQGEECITAESLREALRRLGETRSVEECRGMIRRFDQNDDGVISFDEFRNMMMCAC